MEYGVGRTREKGRKSFLTLQLTVLVMLGCSPLPHPHLGLLVGPCDRQILLLVVALWSAPQSFTYTVDKIKSYLVLVL